MKKNLTINTFNDGLIMDLNPLVTPNKVLCNALNATMITMNGNENILLNDMGNCRVESTFLPQGYIPLGTAELGGIIYIVSYNPQENRCLIGSFPSPERNVATNEISNNICELNNSDFKYDEKLGALIYYLKKDLNSNLIFNPGDKFIVYGNSIFDNYSSLYDESKYNLNDYLIAKNQTLKLDLGTITSQGKFVKFDHLKKYQKYSYHIYDNKNGLSEISNGSTITSQPYNIFSSKISGLLVLIAELIQFNSFLSFVTHKFSKLKFYLPDLTLKLSGKYKFIPYKFNCEIKIFKKNNCEGTFSYDYYITDNDIKNTLDFKSYEIEILDFLFHNDKINNPIYKKLSELSNMKYFDSSNRSEEYLIKYNLIPCMNWGPIKYLTVSGLIDLDKIGTGYINLNSWKYYKQDNLMSITWGLDTYEKDNYHISDVSIEFTRLLNKTTKETVIYNINQKPSYHGIFYESIPLDKDYYRLNYNKLVSNTLYLAKIIVKSVPNSSEYGKEETSTFFRWLYTNNVFNDLYYTKITDYLSELLSFKLTTKNKYNIESTDINSISSFGIINPNVNKMSEEELNIAKNSKSSLSAILYEKKYNAKGEIEILLENDYSSFDVSLIDTDFEINTLNNDTHKIDFTTSNEIKFTKLNDSNSSNYLKNESEIVTDDLKNHLLKEKSSSDEILNLKNYIKLNNNKLNLKLLENKYTFDLQCEVLQLIKAYCTKSLITNEYSGKMVPLAYDEDTFGLYNLVFNNNLQKWVPSKIGTFGFWERKGVDGKAVIGIMNSNASSDIQVLSGDSVGIDFTSDTDVLNAELNLGWSGPAMFSIHKLTYKNYEGAQKYEDDESIFSTAIDYSTKYSRLMLMLKSNISDYFYPIDFSFVSTISDTQFNTIINKNCDLTNNFAQILNNLYRFVPEILPIPGLVPDSVIYMDNCKYSLNIPLEIKSNANYDPEIKLKLDDSEIKLSEVLLTFKQLNIIDEKNKDIDLLKNNITYKVNKLNKIFYFKIEDLNTIGGIELRNHIMSSYNSNLGIAVFDYSGKNILPSRTYGVFDKFKLYLVDKVNNIYSVKPASNFSPKYLDYKYSNSSINITPNSGFMNISYKNMNEKYTLNEFGQLILKDPLRSEFQFKAYKKDNHGENGKVVGYLNIKLLENYAYYTKHQK